MTPAATAELLEREAELAQVRTAIEAAVEGKGGVLLVEGPPGIGKTEMLRASRGLASDAGATVLTARGSELEREFAFGVARQLFQDPVTALAEDERRQALSGAAALAGSLLELDENDSARAGGEIFPVLHGLHWLCANLSLTQPLILFVDDAHWADEPSLRFIHYLAGRIEELPVLAVVGSRSTRPEAPVELLETTRAEQATTVMSPAPLSALASGRVLREAFGSDAAPEFTKASWEASGGNPFLLTELARSLVAEGFEPSAETAARVEQISSEPVSRSIFPRLARMGEDAQELARWAAVLGDSAEPGHAAELAGVDKESALVALDGLAAAHILASGTRLAFAHPLIGAAIYEDLAEGDRSNRHARAARRLRDRGAAPEQVASHLLACAPGSDPEAATTLVAAARDAVERGAPAVGIKLLERALEEPVTPAGRHEIVEQFAGAARLVGDPRAEDWAVKAIAAAPDIRARAATFLRVVWLASGLKRPELVGDMLETADAIADEDPEVAGQIEALAEAVALTALVTDEELTHRIDSWELEGPDAPVARRAKQAFAALLGVLRNGRAKDVLELARRASSQDDLARHDTLSRWPYWFAASARVWAGDAAGSLVGIDAAVEDATRRGSNTFLQVAFAHRCLAHRLLGNLEAAEADAFAALELAAASTYAGQGIVYCYTIGALIERGHLEGAQQLVARVEKEVLAEPPSFFQAMFLNGRGELRLALNEPGAALGDFERVREMMPSDWTGPGEPQWIRGCARGLSLLGRSDEAGELADLNLERAREFGAARVFGAALRLRGVVRGGSEGLDDLREALDVLRGDEARLEFAKALVELGAALRRANQRKEAREPLREGLDLARRCGATPLAERAREELKATGAKPRKEVFTGVESLTPSELRTAKLAAEGLTNREIAQQLFVTQKTVETHLRHCFQKLDIKGRGELAGKLAEAAA